MKKHKLYYLLLIPILLLGSFLIFGYDKIKQDQPKSMNLAEYNKEIGKHKNVLVYFHASWCMACTKMGPIINEVDSNYKALKVLNIDLDYAKEVADKFEINSLPVLIFYINGKIEWTHIGVIDKKILLEKISYLN